jgi:hypothetical protein
MVAFPRQASRLSLRTERVVSTVEMMKAGNAFSSRWSIE